MYRQQSEPHEPVVRVTCASCIGTRGPVHIRTSHNPEPEHEQSGPSFRWTEDLIVQQPAGVHICNFVKACEGIRENGVQLGEYTQRQLLAAMEMAGIQITTHIFKFRVTIITWCINMAHPLTNCTEQDVPDLHVIRRQVSNTRKAYGNDGKMTLKITILRNHQLQNLKE
jgi:hypothetical protein